MSGTLLADDNGFAQTTRALSSGKDLRLFVIQSFLFHTNHQSCAVVKYLGHFLSRSIMSASLLLERKQYAALIYRACGSTVGDLDSL